MRSDRPRGLLAFVWAVAALLTACAPAPRAAAPTPPGATIERIQTSDGLTLDARLFAADADRVVILMHGYPERQADWFETAGWLQSQGYSALTFDFRGYGASEGERQAEALEEDALSAVRFAGQRGYDHVVLLGGAMGGAAAIAAAAEDAAVDGVFALSPPTRFAALDTATALAAVRSPLVVVAAREDTSAAESVEWLMEQTRLRPSQVVQVDGAETGGQLMRSPQAAEVRAHLLTFLADVAGQPSEATR